MSQYPTYRLTWTPALPADPGVRAAWLPERSTELLRPPSLTMDTYSDEHAEWMESLARDLARGLAAIGRNPVLTKIHAVKQTQTLEVD